MKKIHYKWNLIQIKHPFKEGAFGRTYFRDIQALMENGTEIHGNN